MKKWLTILILLGLVASMIVYGYSGYTFAIAQVDMMFFLVLMGGILVIGLVHCISMIVQMKKEPVSGTQGLMGLVLIAFMIVLSCQHLNVISFSKQETVPDFYGKSITEVNEWADQHQVEITVAYENSDMIDQYGILYQNVAAGTMVSQVETMQVVVSEGPNYDKSVVVPQMLGWTLDEAVAYIQANFLNHVEIKFEESGEDRYLVIEQSKYGQMYRRDEIVLIVSIGSLSTLPEATMENLVGMSEFDATLWLNKNAIPFTITRAFSDEIERGHVISQSVAVQETVNSSSKVELVISKGKEINVLNLTSMTVEEVTAWVVENQLNISFKDAYDDTVPIGNIIKTNHQEGDIIEEGDTIQVTISKGQLKMEEFGSLSQFKSWADSYDIKYEVKHEYHDTVKRGGVISYSHKKGEIIKNGETITVTVSKGKAITVPNFKGMTKANITTKCNSLGLTCSYSYGSYSSSTKKDVATGQSVTSGKKVEQGTAVTITLSRGKAKSYSLSFSSAILGTSYNASKSSLSSYFKKNYPGVTFKFVAKAHNSLSSGQIHPDSPTKPGATVTQGKTYTIYIVK